MVDFDTIRELRALCGASISSCKKALEEADGDMKKALEVLRREGVEIAEKKSSRATNAGVIDAYVHQDRRLGVLVEIKCETDFVARNDEFRAFAHELAMQAAAAAPKSVDDFLKQSFIKDPAKTVEDRIRETIAKFGENVELVAFSRLEF